MNEEVFDPNIPFEKDSFCEAFRAQEFDIPGFENYLDNVLCLGKHIAHYYEGGFHELSMASLSPYLQRVVDVCDAIAVETIVKGLEMKDLARSFMTLRPPVIFTRINPFQRYTPNEWILYGRYDLFQNLVDFWEKDVWQRYTSSQFDYIICVHNTTDILDILLANGYTPHPQALYYAVTCDRHDIVQRLTAWGMTAVPVQLCDGGKYFSPLQVAIRNRNVSMLHTLFLHGAKVEDDSRILVKALQQGDKETLAALLCYVEDVNVCNETYEHRLFVAISGLLDLPFLQMLVKAGADINYVDITSNGKKRTPLSLAISRRNKVAEDYLRSVGAVL
jgi:hypothetical protein